MKRLSFTLRVVTLAIFTVAFASLAQAQATRTWVSGVGDDVNPCSRTAPCKTFAGAISKTAANGEIDALDPAGFGALTITKSITVEGQGTLAGVLNSTGVNGIVINDASSGSPNTIIVSLRNLSINGAGTGADGIRFLSGRTLHVENCVITGQRFSAASDGIEINPTTGTTFNISVKDTIIHDSAGDGIRQATSIGTLNASYDGVSLYSNGANGLEATGGTANISRSTIDANVGSGLVASGGAIINANGNVITSNGANGINNTSPSSVRLNDNSIHRNGTGVAGTGTYQSFGNNKVIGNNTADVAVGTTITNVSATNLK